jgi:enoyl-CoA hydratase/carnithine racemase
MGELLVERDGHVAIVTLNRPERLNAITGPMLDAFSKALIELDDDADVRVVVITGAGRGFCAGLDLQDQMSGQGLGEGQNKGEGIGSTTQRFNLRDAPPVVLHNMDTPTICALNGGAAGYGMDLSLGCDIRIASDRGKLSAAFTKRGVLPESGGTWLLPRIVGWSAAAEIMFTGRTLTAEQLLEAGLVSRVVAHDSLIPEVLKVANEIAANAPLAVQATKRMMRMGQDETFDANVHHVFLQLLPLFRSRDFKEGVTSFLEKRTPEFEGR